MNFLHTSLILIRLCKMSYASLEWLNILYVKITVIINILSNNVIAFSWYGIWYSQKILLVQIFGRFVPGRILRHFPRRKIITLVKFLLVFSPIWGGWLLRFTGILRRENQKNHLLVFSPIWRGVVIAFYWYFWGEKILKITYWYFLRFGGGWLLRFTGIFWGEKIKKVTYWYFLGWLTRWIIDNSNQLEWLRTS